MAAGIAHHSSGGNDATPSYANQTAGTMTVSGGVTNGDSVTAAGASVAPLSVLPGTADVKMLAFTLTMGSGAEWDFGQIGLSELGTAADAVITAVRLYHDANANGNVDGSETMLASGVFTGGSATLALGSPFRVTPGTKNFLITVTVSPSAPSNDTIQLRINANSIIHSATGGTDNNPVFADIDSIASTVLSTTGNSDLVISEVFEGTSGSLKYVEIANLSTATINLASPQLRLRRYANGSLTATSINLTGSIGPNGFYVVANNNTDFNASFTTATANQANTNISHNGNDVYDLQNAATSDILDTFAGDLAGTSADFALNADMFRVLEQLPNDGAWGTPVSGTAPPDLGASPSGYWVARSVTAGNGNAAAIGTPGYGTIGGAGQEVPVSLSGFSVE